MTITPELLVQREVYYCVSSLVSTLSNGYGAVGSKDSADLSAMVEQAFELASPIDDWEEAAIQEGWTLENDGSDGGQRVYRDSTDGQTWCASNWQELCEEFDIEPYQREIFEHWIVSDWLADKLAAKGEKVDKDFAALIVWGRTTTGQGIASDSVIEQITAEFNAA